MSVLRFYCPDCQKAFHTHKHRDNHFFLADKIANCPDCGNRSEELPEGGK